MMLQKNDEGAFTAIYERYHKGLYVIAYKYKRPGACKRCGTIYIYEIVRIPFPAEYQDQSEKLLVYDVKKSRIE